MTSEGDTLPEERRKKVERPAFSQAREKVTARHREFVSDVRAALDELKKKTLEELKDL
jgi:hypothetical protein